MMPWLTENVPLSGPRTLSAWRSLALAVWSDVSAASVPAVMTVDAEPMLAFIDRMNAETSVRVTMAHCVGKAVAEAYRQLPAVNCLIRLGRLYQRRDVDIFFPVALDRQGEDMSGAVLRNVDRLPLREVAEQLAHEARAVRSDAGGGFGAFRGDGLVGRLVARTVVRIGGLLLYTLNVWHPALGVPKDSFGGAAVTDLSQFGADLAFPPLLPMARLPFVIGICPITEEPVLEGGAWRTRKTLRLAAVFDHRVIDGVYAGRISQVLRDVFARPDAYFAETR